MLAVANPVHHLDLERSTQLFGRLADPNGANNPLSQVLYGLALRYDSPPPILKAFTLTLIFC